MCGVVLRDGGMLLYVPVTWPETTSYRYMSNVLVGNVQKRKHTQDAPEPIAEEVQQEQENEDGSGRISFAENAVKNMKLMTRDALAPFRPSFDASPEVHPLPITPSLSIETGHSKREDKPPAEEDDAIRSMYFPVSNPR
jgi:hypothetical protein